MDQDTKNKIHDELVALLKREPTDDEISNGQTDAYIIQRVQAKQSAEQTTALQQNMTSLQTNVAAVQQALPATSLPTPLPTSPAKLGI